MKRNVENKTRGFSRNLIQEFMLLRRKAQEKKDDITKKTLDVILNGITELTCAVADGSAQSGTPLRFSPGAYDIFSSLAKYPNDPLLLRKAGAHYLVEWHLPQSALSHFERALDLSSFDRTLPMLIQIANLAIKRKNETESDAVTSDAVNFTEASERIDNY